MESRPAVTLPILVFCALVAAVAIAYAQSFDLRLGQWEYTIGGMQIPPGDLAQLPPAARAQFEAMMKQAATNQSCLTAEDLKDLNLSKSDEDNCKVTSKKVTGATADITMTCTGNRPRTQTMHYEALSRESMRGTIKTTGPNGPSDLTITGKWIGAVCKEG